MLREIRKLGSNHCDFPSMIACISIFLRLLVINIDKRNTKKIPLISYIVTIASSLSYTYVYLLSVIWFVFWYCQETGEKIPAIVVFSLGIASEIAVYKLIFLYIYRHTVRIIVEGYITLDSQVTSNSRTAFNLLHHLRIVKRRAVVFWCIIVSNGLLYIMKPIILPGRHLMEDDFVLLGLDPIFESPNYEIAFVACALSIFFICYLTSNITIFLIVITGYTEAQLVTLSEELANLWDDALKHIKHHCGDTEIESNEHTHTEEERKLINTFINEHLVNIIKNHIMNINLIKQVEIVFSGAIGMEFLVLIISLIAELLGGLENTYMELPFALIQVTMDCIIGQRLIDASNVFSHAVYSCKWENFDVKNAKLVLLMLRNSQKTLYLSAGGITILSFVCLMSVFRSIYSAYTTLQSTI